MFSPWVIRVAFYEIEWTMWSYLNLSLATGITERGGVRHVALKSPNITFDIVYRNSPSSPILDLVYFSLDGDTGPKTDTQSQLVLFFGGGTLQFIPFLRLSVKV